MRILMLILPACAVALVCPFAAAAAETRFKQSDVIDIRMLHPASLAPEFDAQYTISPAGGTRFEGIGLIRTEGLTPAEVENSIESAFRTKGVFAKAEVAVRLWNPVLAATAVTVRKGGREGAEIAMPLSPDMRLYDAIARAGGFDYTDDHSRVELVRRRRAAVLDMREPSADRSNNPPLKDGDTVVLHPLKGPRLLVQIRAMREMLVRCVSGMEKLSGHLEDEHRFLNAFRFKPGDVIQVKLQSPAVPGDRAEVRCAVSADGAVRLPWARERIPLAGLNLSTTEDLVTGICQQAVPGGVAQATIQVRRPDGRPFPFVMVEGHGVAEGGPVPIIPGQRLQAAITAAGGFTSAAAQHRVVLRRGTAEETWNLTPPVVWEPLLQDGDRITISATGDAAEEKPVR